MPLPTGLVQPQSNMPPQVPPSAPPDQEDAPAPAANAVPPAPLTPQEDDAPKLPHELITMPAIQALMAGSPAAVSMSMKGFDKRSEVEILKKHKALLQQAGFGFYRSLSGQVGVMFNSLYVHPQDLQAADNAGKLQVIAPPFDVVDHAVSKSGIHNPVLKRGSVPQGLATPTQVAPPQISAGMAPGTAPSPNPGGAAVNRKLMQARLTGMNPGAPTSGASPGAGRFMNSILKPVV